VGQRARVCGMESSKFWAEGRLFIKLSPPKRAQQGYVLGSISNQSSKHDLKRLVSGYDLTLGWHPGSGTARPARALATLRRGVVWAARLEERNKERKMQLG
jgi:hypothetical protein